jgi:hypothetical protein
MIGLYLYPPSGPVQACNGTALAFLPTGCTRNNFWQMFAPAVCGQSRKFLRTAAKISALVRIIVARFTVLFSLIMCGMYETFLSHSPIKITECFETRSVCWSKPPLFSKCLHNTVLSIFVLSASAFHSVRLCLDLLKENISPKPKNRIYIISLALLQTRLIWWM